MNEGLFKSILVSINDVKGETFGQPYEAMNEKVAIRMFEQMVDETTMIYRFPGDFRLVQVAEFDKITGVVNAHQKILLTQDGVKALVEALEEMNQAVKEIEQ